VSDLLARQRPALLALAASVGLAAGGLGRLPTAVVVLGALASLVPLTLLDGPARVAALAAFLLLAGLWWGGLRAAALERSVLVSRIGESGEARVAVTAPPRRTRFALRMLAEVRRFRRVPLRERVLLELPPGRAPPQGALLALYATIRAPRGPEDRFDERAWLARRGVHVVLRGRDARVVGRRGGLAALADRLHAHLASAVAPGLRGERRAVVAAVVLGEDEGLSEELESAFRASGLAHLLAVSGTNVGFIAVGVLALAWLLGLPRSVGQSAVVAAIVAYVLAVGWQPSVVRAGVAGVLVALAWLAARPRDRWHFCAVGALVLLAWNPHSVREPGFQLSFAAVAAIFVLVPPLRRGLDGYPVPARLAEVVAVSTACGLVTAPLLVLQFGAVPLWSIPANALAFPVVGALLGLGLAAGAIEPLLPSVAMALAWVNGWLAAYLAAVARLVAGLPWAEVSSAVGLAASAALVVATAAATRLDRRGRRRLGALVAAAALLLAGFRAWPEPVRPPPTGLRVTFLDVGQGDAALLEVAEGALLVDEGPPEGDVAAQLRRLGVRRLAAIVLTHPQRDHVGGAPAVLRALPVDAVLDPQLAVDGPEHREAVAVARERGVRIVTARRGLSLRLGRLLLRVLWPDGPGTPAEDPNERAVVLVASYGAVDVLLPADAESGVTSRLDLPPVEILKVAHHGSADAGLPALLRRLRPQVAVISVGARNDYGHPAPSTLAALRVVPRVLRTDREGRVTIETDGRGIAVGSER
jgi:competence protein ComEC